MIIPFLIYYYIMELGKDLGNPLLIFYIGKLRCYVLFIHSSIHPSIHRASICERHVLGTGNLKVNKVHNLIVMGLKL